MEPIENKLEQTITRISRHGLSNEQMNHNTIYIIGAGAIGKALAVFLQQQGREVILLRGRTADAPPHIAQIEIDIDGKTIRENIRIYTLYQYPVLKGLVVVTNKSYGNENIAAALQGRVQNTPIVILQNGLHIEQPFMNEGFPEIYRAVLLATSQKLSENRFRFKPVSPSPIGIIKGNAAILSNIVQELNTSFFEFRAEADITPIIWTKAIVNTIFNSVCPLLDVDNGIFQRNNASLEIAKRIIAECIRVAALEHVKLQPDQVLHTLLQISKASTGQFISTHHDIKNKRPTEIYALNGAIVQMAGEHNLADTVSETRLLGEMLQIKSALAML